MISANDAVEELFSAVCKGCGGKKKPERSFCFKCFKSLPGDLQRALYQRVGEGYEEAVTRAHGLLGTTIVGQ